jgi:hypothetical protein
MWLLPSLEHRSGGGLIFCSSVVVSPRYGIQFAQDICGHDTKLDRALKRRPLSQVRGSLQPRQQAPDSRWRILA